MHNIQHIMPHMGPGVGKALSALAQTARRQSKRYCHKILLLEEPKNFTYITPCLDQGIEVVWPQEKEERHKLLCAADIVQLEWWHHPLVLGFLEELSQLPIRLTVWSHISGCNYPSIPFPFLQLPEQFFLTTAYSYENPAWSVQERREARRLCTVACGSGGFDNVTGITPKKHDLFTIGYIGTLDFCKLHPAFVDFCAQVDVPHSHFVLVGNPANQETLLAQAGQYDLADRFEFTGFVTDVRPCFERFDVFAYLLNPDHFGATDNALLEAMAAGMPIIILDQCGERQVIQHLETGLIVKTPKEFGEAIRFLYEHPEERQRLGKNAKHSAFSNFSPEQTMRILHQGYDEIISRPRRQIDFRPVFGSRPYDWFLTGLGGARSRFEEDLSFPALKTALQQSPEILKGSTKSSIPHFSNCFPTDQSLKRCSELIADIERSDHVARGN